MSKKALPRPGPKRETVLGAEVPAYTPNKLARPDLSGNSSFATEEDGSSGDAEVPLSPLLGRAGSMAASGSVADAVFLADALEPAAADEGSEAPRPESRSRAESLA